jgi:hypothetical protein
MMTIDTAQLAEVTGGVQQAPPKPVVVHEPSPTVPTPASSTILEGLRGPGASGAATRSGTWTWGQQNSTDQH